jgi:hypothetical protein
MKPAYNSTQKTNFQELDEDFGKIGKNLATDYPENLG